MIRPLPRDTLHRISLGDHRAVKFFEDMAEALGGSGVACLPADVASVGDDALTVAPGLEFSAEAGAVYHLRAVLHYSGAGTGTGSRFVLSGPAGAVRYSTRQPASATSETLRLGLSAYDLPAVANSGAAGPENVAIIEGFCAPTVAGLVQVRFAARLAADPVTLRAGSALYWRRTA